MRGEECSLVWAEDPYPDSIPHFVAEGDLSYRYLSASILYRSKKENIVIYAIVAGVSFIIGALVVYIAMKISLSKKSRMVEIEAKARASAIEQEARNILNQARIERKTKELEQEKRFAERLGEIEKRHRGVIVRERELAQEEERIRQQLNQIETKRKNLDALEKKRREIIDENIQKIESLASMTRNEARELLLKQVEERISSEIAAMVRKKISIANEDATKRANYILAQATTRYAGEFAGERLINSITLPTDEHKGRIIGKEGRNIKTLEQLLGVDIIIDETPGVIVVSSFNLYRRAIATRVIELLVEDGRIHPGRIEEIHARVEKEFERSIYEEGENVLIDLGLFPMHEDLVRLIGRLKYRASYGQNALAHSLEVARLARLMAAEMDGDEKLAMRAGLLHDIGKALTQDYGGSHVELGAELCRKYNEHPTVVNAIYAHHGHTEPDSVESAAVCAADALSAARPGARREVIESFTRRVTEIEDIAMSLEGVEQAYAINAGRELRVFVDPSNVNDDEAAMLCHNIAKDIEDKVQYPGEIKVNVIREVRMTEYAR
jgi:ribonuclease Y